MVLRWKDKTTQDSSNRSSRWREGVICLVMIACSGFVSGLFYRFDFSLVLQLIAVVVATLATVGLCLRQVSIDLY